MGSISEFGGAIGGAVLAGTAVYFGQPELVPAAMSIGTAGGSAIGAAAERSMNKHKNNKQQRR